MTQMTHKQGKDVKIRQSDLQTMLHIFANVISPPQQCVTQDEALQRLLHVEQKIEICNELAVQRPTFANEVAQMCKKEIGVWYQYVNPKYWNWALQLAGKLRVAIDMLLHVYSKYTHLEKLQDCLYTTHMRLHHLRNYEQQSYREIDVLAKQAHELETKINILEKRKGEYDLLGFTKPDYFTKWMNNTPRSGAFVQIGLEPKQRTHKRKGKKTKSTKTPRSYSDVARKASAFV